MKKREIKFRVWNGEQMISPDYITRDGIAHWKENSIPESSDKLMQFTGLKDKNGKEIYEGDVIITANGTRSVIKFGQWYYPFDSQPNHGIGFSFDGGEPLGECIGGSGSMYEIIGNIYETPELINS